MRVFLYAIGICVIAADLSRAVDPECAYRRARNLPLHWAIATDCGRYYRCTRNNVKREVVCAPNKEYSMRIGKCVPSGRGTCQLNLLEPVIEGDLCNGQLSGAYVPDPAYCRHFYICSDDVAYPQTCDDGSRFDANAANCVPDDGAECWQNLCLNANNGVNMASPSSCKSYYTCENNQAIAATCENGEYFNAQTQTCVEDETQQQCWENYCMSQAHGAFLPDPTDCYSYYICLDGQPPITANCDAGTYFDSNVMACQQGECPETTTTESTTETITESTMPETSEESTLPTTDSTVPETSEESTLPTTESTVPETSEESTLPTTESTVTETSEETTITETISTSEVTTETCTEVTITTTEACTSETTTEACAVETTTTTTEVCAEEITTTTTVACVGETTTPCTVESTPNSRDIRFYKTGPQKRARRSVDLDISQVSSQFVYSGSNELLEKNTALRDEHENAESVIDKYGQSGVENLEKLEHFSFVDALSIELTENENYEKKPFVYVDAASNEVVLESPHSRMPTNIQPQFIEISDVEVDKNASRRVSCLGLYYEGQLIAHPYECRKFQVCHEGQLQLQDCGLGKYFDAMVGSCQVDRYNICPIKSQVAPSLLPTYEISPLCLGLYSEGEMVPHAEDCRQFQICTRGRLVLQDCGLGKYFDSVNNTCQLDVNAMCASNRPSCLSLYYEGQLVQHPSDCHKFQVCYEGRLIVQHCGVGKYYEIESGSCVLDTDNVCNYNSSTTEEDNLWLSDQRLLMQEHLSCLGIYDEGQLVAHPSDCRKYQICHAGRLYERDCGLGNYYDSARGACQSDVMQLCASNKPTCLGRYFEGERMAHATNCRKFHVCFQRQLSTQDCGFGRYYNNATAACELDQEGWCADEIASNGENLLWLESGASCLGLYAEGQMLVDTLNCRQYQICHAGRLITRDCGMGNYFDGSTESCQRDIELRCEASSYAVAPAWPNAQDLTDTLACVGQLEGHLLPYHADCNKYQICMRGQPILGDCGLGNYFDERIASCQVDVFNSCKSQYLDAANSSAIRQISLRPQRYLKHICYGAYDEGQLLRHPRDCSRYLVCSAEGALMPHYCGLGNFFNAYTGVCEPDTLAACRPKRINITEVIYQPTSVLAAVETSNDCATSCAGGANEGDIVGHSSCDKYYICTRGTLVEHSCGSCYRFESCTGSCVLDECRQCWPAESDCNGEPSPESKICEGQQDGTRLPDVYDCANSFVCYDGAAIADPCYAGELYNAKLQECEPDVDAVCTNPCEGTTGIQYLPNMNCSKFYYCHDGITTVKECAYGEGFDMELKVCRVDAHCADTFCIGKPDGTTYPIAGDKTKYYYCLDDMLLISNCEEDQIYMSDLGVCLLQPSSDCDQKECAGVAGVTNAFPTLSSAINAFCYCSDGSAYKKYCPAEYNFDAEFGICRSSAPCDTELCLDMPDYTISVNRNDTNAFCMCVQHVPVVVPCPNNEIFNAVTMLCQVTPNVDKNCDNTYCLNQPDYTIFPALSTDAGFCICNSGGANYVPCGKSQTFNSVYGICLSNEATDGCLASNCANAPQSVFPASNDDNAFCFCVDERTVLKKTCKNNEKFNPNLLICM